MLCAKPLNQFDAFINNIIRIRRANGVGIGLIDEGQMKVAATMPHRKRRGFDQACQCLKCVTRRTRFPLKLFKIKHDLGKIIQPEDGGPLRIDLRIGRVDPRHQPTIGVRKRQPSDPRLPCSLGRTNILLQPLPVSRNVADGQLSREFGYRWEPIDTDHFPEPVGCLNRAVIADHSRKRRRCFNQSHEPARIVDHRFGLAAHGKALPNRPTGGDQPDTQQQPDQSGNQAMACHHLITACICAMKIAVQRKAVGSNKKGPHMAGPSLRFLLPTDQ